MDIKFYGAVSAIGAIKKFRYFFYLFQFKLEFLALQPQVLQEETFNKDLF
jgi:hypothetical protein